MNEKELRRRIVRISVLSVAVSLLLIICFGVVFYSMRSAEQSSYEAQMQAFINEYKINVERQFDSDIASLQTLSSFISSEDMLDPAFLEEGIDGIGRDALFLRFGYCEKGSNTVRISRTQSMGGDLLLDEQPEQIQDIIRGSWEGESAVSYMYTDQSLDRKIIAYSVPMYISDEIVGSLIGIKDLQVFEELLNKSTLSQVHMDVAWVNQQGEYITWSQNSFIEASLGPFFSTEYISGSERNIIREMMSGGESYVSRFEYDGKSYPLYFEPLERNGWYLVCTDRTSEIRSPVYFKFIIVIATFFIIMVVSIFSIVYGARFLRRNSRTLIQMAYYDSLTGAFNLPRFRQEVTELLKADSAYSAVVFNIRHFRYINEIFGYAQADRLLCRVSDILKKSLGDSECCCRYMADEFYMLLHTTDAADVQKRLEKIMDEVAHLADAINKNYPIMLYAGAAVNDGAQTNKAVLADTKASVPDNPWRLTELLIHKAEFALKHARETREKTVVFYDEAIHQADNLQNEIERNMKRALEDGEFKLYLQPQKDLKAGRIASAEALVRWIRKDGSIIGPDKFIPAFEKNGFCARLDMYMVEQVCRQLREWIDKGYAPITISVNQSKLLFYQSDYVARLCEITDKYAIPRRYIVLEILEGLAAESIGELNKNISILHQKGFKISLDDFGTGYSSLNLLGSLEIDEVKLDRGFLAKNPGKSDHKLCVLMQNVIRLAGDLNISTVVEGVETQENEAFIKEIGADFGQGYYYSRPVPCAKYEKMYMEPSKP